MKCTKDCFSYGSTFGHNYIDTDGYMHWHSGAPETKELNARQLDTVNEMANMLKSLIADVTDGQIHNFSAKTELQDIAKTLNLIANNL